MAHIDMASELKLIVGLGNPGPQYQGNRHNVGFQFVDALARANGLEFARRQFRAFVGSGAIDGQRVLLAKPLTFMNLSGIPVGALASFYKVPPADILVAYDDLDLPVGRVRMRPGGSSGGHKGMKSIIEQLRTDQFPRLRIGIGRPTVGDPIGYVLQDFRGDEKIEILRSLDRAMEATLVWLQVGIDEAMNRFNRAPDTEERVV
jgi:peptidyl-tRNA hydrolase, PTH1 family